MSVTEQLLAKRKECFRREQQPPETLGRRVWTLTSRSTGRPVSVVADRIILPEMTVPGKHFCH